MLTNETVFEWCKTNKEILLAAQAAGDPIAKMIVTTHDLYVAFPEHIALGLLEQAVEDWHKRIGVNMFSDEEQEMLAEFLDDLYEAYYDTREGLDQFSVVEIIAILRKAYLEDGE